MYDLHEEDDASLNCLEGTTGKEKGGLVIMKKGPSENKNQHTFKVPVGLPPRSSVLGLDKLAELKRKQDEEFKASKKSKVSSFRDSDSDESDSDNERQEYRKRKENKSQKERS